ncbi:MAG: Cys-tRNA(Pro) deacylase [Ruminococcus sp.]|nr:Cys-tRNA(Pro) deacylase [Ruminococcus sp.]
MSKDKIEKTNAMRILERNKVLFVHRVWEQATSENTGTELATALGQNPDQVFKTLVTTTKSGLYYVFMIPVSETLDLKKAAAAVNEKSLSMLKAKELFPITGYVHGGCSPIGMKKQFPTVIHKTAKDFKTILFSAGKIGHQLEVSLDDLCRAVKFSLEDIVV